MASDHVRNPSPAAVREAEPLNRETRRARTEGAGKYSVALNLTDFGARLHSITPGCEVAVEVYPDGIWITEAEAGDRGTASGSGGERR